MVQLDERRYRIEGVSFGKKEDDPKKKMSKFFINIDSANRVDAMALQLLENRKLFLATKVDKRMIKIGHCTVLRGDWDATKDKTRYWFEISMLEWMPEKHDVIEWSDDKKFSLFVIDTSIQPLNSEQHQSPEELVDSEEEKEDDDTDSDNFYEDEE